MVEELAQALHDKYERSQEEKLAKFREELEEEIVARAKKDAKEAEHKLHHS